MGVPFPPSDSLRSTANRESCRGGSRHPSAGMFGDMQSGVCARSAQQVLPGAKRRGGQFRRRGADSLPTPNLRSSVSWNRDARRLLLEVLAQHRHLALVVGAEVGAVEALGRRCHPLQAELADRLAVLDHEGDVAGAHLERRAAAVAAALRVVAEAGVEEAGVVGAQLARRSGRRPSSRRRSAAGCRPPRRRAAGRRSPARARPGRRARGRPGPSSRSSGRRGSARGRPAGCSSSPGSRRCGRSGPERSRLRKRPSETASSDWRSACESR